MMGPVSNETVEDKEDRELHLGSKPVGYDVHT